MVVVHVIFGLVVGLVAAVWACSENYSLFAMLGAYMLAGNLGVLASAAVSLVRLPGREHAQKAQEV